MQLGRLVERVNRFFGKKRLTGKIFLPVAKAFGTAWVDAFAYKFIALKLHYDLFKNHLIIPAKTDV
jgi:hypothetical protein